MGKTPAIDMRFVDDADESPVANAKVTFCGTSWEGTLTGHGGRSKTLFRIEAATDANGALKMPEQEFDRRPFGTSTNYDHSVLLIEKPGYAPYKIQNCCKALGEYAAVSTWGYNGATIRLKRSRSGMGENAARSTFIAGECGEGWAPPVDPRTAETPPPAPPRPVKAPHDPGEQHRRAAQPATVDK